MKTVFKIGAAAVAGAAVLAAGSALAQGAPPSPAERAADTRQSLMTLVGWSMGPMFGIMRGGEYDAEVVHVSAERLAALSLMVEDAFAMDTSGEDIETEALDAIWESPEDFSEKAAAFTTAVAGLQAALEAEDEEAGRSAIGAIGQSCGGCHDNYRVE